MRPKYVECYDCKILIPREEVKDTNCWLAISHNGPNEIIVPLCPYCWDKRHMRLGAYKIGQKPDDILPLEIKPIDSNLGIRKRR